MTSFGALALLLYVAIAVLMALYGCCWLPETSGHSLEQCAQDISDHAESDSESSSSAGC